MLGDLLRIRLEPYALSHVELLHQAAIDSTQHLFAFMPWCHPSFQLEEARSFVIGQISNFASRTAFEFAIRSAESGEFLGGCGLNQVDIYNCRANLGYWVRRSAV